MITISPGETLHRGRYYVIDRAGRGTFGSVLDVYDCYRRRRVALKVIRSVPRYLAAAKTEAEIILRLQARDPVGESGCVRLLKHFSLRHKGTQHMCLGFEKLGQSLYAFCKGNRHRGFRLCDVRRVGLQLLTSLAFCHQNGLIHTDLKPENILLTSSRYSVSRYGDPSHVEALQRRLQRVAAAAQEESEAATTAATNSAADSSVRRRSRSASRSRSGGSGVSAAASAAAAAAAGSNSAPINDTASTSSSSAGTAAAAAAGGSGVGKSPPYRIPLSPSVRLIDFGASTFPEHRHPDIISTRQYRPPEVILRLGWSYASDIWSAACILAELFTGELLFTTHDDLEHLALMEKVLGRKLPREMLGHAIRGNGVNDGYSGRKNSYSSSSGSYAASSSGGAAGRSGYPPRDWTRDRPRSTSTLRADALVCAGTLALRWPENAVDAASYYVVKDALTLEETVLAGARLGARLARARGAGGRRSKSSRSTGDAYGDDSDYDDDDVDDELPTEGRTPLLPRLAAAKADANAAVAAAGAAAAGAAAVAGVTVMAELPPGSLPCAPDSAEAHHPTLQELRSFLDLLTTMLAYSPEDRPSAKAALGHPFFAPERDVVPPPEFLNMAVPLPPHERR